MQDTPLTNKIFWNIFTQYAYDVRNINGNWFEDDKQFRLKMSKNTSISFGTINACYWICRFKLKKLHNSHNFSSNVLISILKVLSQIPVFTPACTHALQQVTYMHTLLVLDSRLKSSNLPQSKPNIAEFYPQNNIYFRPYHPKSQGPRFQTHRFNYSYGPCSTAIPRSKPRHLECPLFKKWFKHGFYLNYIGPRVYLQSKTTCIKSASEQPCLGAAPKRWRLPVDFIIVNILTYWPKFVLSILCFLWSSQFYDSREW